MVRAQIFAAAVLVFSSCFAFSQNNQVVRVGVATLENRSPHDVPRDVERDRLVSAINQLKPDKKAHIKLEAVPLDGNTGNDVVDEAAKKDCNYVVYPVLLEVNQIEPGVLQPGTIQTNPASPLGLPTPGTQAARPEFEATVAYKLYNIKAHTTTAGPAISDRHYTSEVDVVSQVLDRVASSVFDAIRKGGPSHPMQEHD